ncbi:MAG: nucleoside deaminase [Magnetococcus sp. YQC-5]
MNGFDADAITSVDTTGDADGIADVWLATERSVSLLALVVATFAGVQDEVPVGAIVTDHQGRILAAAGNRCVSGADPTGHAEMRSMRLAANRMENYRLTDARLTVTLEPCPMCLAAASMARLAQVRFAALRAWPVTTRQTRAPQQNLEHLQGAGALLRNFFAHKRELLYLGQDSALITGADGDEPLGSSIE